MTSSARCCGRPAGSGGAASGGAASGGATAADTASGATASGGITSAGITSTGGPADGTGAGCGDLDVHQHLWPPGLIAALRERTEPPFLDGWTLHVAGEAPYEVDPADHDPVRRAALEPAGRGVLLSLSSPLGIEDLPADEAAPLLDAWHDEALTLGEPFGAWAAVNRHTPDLDALDRAFTAGFAGLQLPATWLATPHDLTALVDVLRACTDADRPVLIHPGLIHAGLAHPGPRRPGQEHPERVRPGLAASDPGEGAAMATPGAGTGPTVASAGPGRTVVAEPWWAAGVAYVAQLHAAYWAWHAVGRQLAPGLRICFVALAGLAPVHHERLAARGRDFGRVDPDVFFETSSYGSQAIDALARAVGIDGIVLGSDRPYAEPIDPTPDHGDAAAFAITHANPNRLLHGGY